jgi:hypothetical protein
MIVFVDVARSTSAFVALGLGPRAYTLRRPNAVGAPARVGARLKAAHDQEEEQP